MRPIKCLKLRLCAQKYNLEKVFQKVNKLIAKNLEIVLQNSDFLLLNMDEVLEILKLRDEEASTVLFFSYTLSTLQWTI